MVVHIRIFFRLIRFLALKPPPYHTCVLISLGIIWWSIVSSPTKFQNNSFVKYVVSSKNVKKTFLSLQSFSDDFSKLLLYSNQVRHGTSFCIEFHDCRLNSLRINDSKSNHKNGSIRVLLAKFLCSIIWKLPHKNEKYSKYSTSFFTGNVHRLLQ